MSTKYADRAFVAINGAALFDVESANFKQNKSRRPVVTMTNDGYNRGFVEGNWDFDISMVIANENQLARPKLEAIDYENNNVSLNWVVGANQFVVNNLFMKDVTDDAPGVGQEVKTTFNFGALVMTDAIGNSSLFDFTTVPGAGT
jgi:hypothetical protein